MHLSPAISWFSFFILYATLNICYRCSLLLRLPNLASCAHFLVKYTGDFAFLFACRYFSFSPSFCHYFHSHLFSLMTKSTSSFHHHVSFRFGLPPIVHPHAVSLALSRHQDPVVFGRIAYTWEQYSQSVCILQALSTLRLGGMVHGLLKYVFILRTPTSNL